MIRKAWKKSIRLKSSGRNEPCITLFILCACTLIGYIFYSLKLSEANIISIYIIGILVISSITSVWIYGVVSSVVGVLFFNFLYADPIFNFYVYDPQYSITTFLMLIASLATNYIMTRFRSHLQKEKLETRRLDILLDTSQHLQKSQDIDGILDVALIQLYQLFEQPVLIYPITDGEVGQPIQKTAENGSDFRSFEIYKSDVEAFIHSERSYAIISVNFDTHAIFFKIVRAEKVFAAICILLDSDTHIVGFEFNLVLAMLDEIAQAIEKYNLQIFNEHIAREAQAERLRSTLLRTVSHDLRTPLTSISGTADILLSKGDQIEPEVLRELYQTIQSDSEWLINLVENLLFITRIDNGTMCISTEFEVLQDVVQESLVTLGKRARNHMFHIEMADEALVVKMDARLIMQVITNIVDNALRFTPSDGEIFVRIFRRESFAVVEVADTGCGIRDEDKEKVFEMFYTTNKQLSDSRRGIGLGLPLARAIANAHGGMIDIADNVPTGTRVSLSLRLEDESESQCVDN